MGDTEFSLHIRAPHISRGGGGILPNSNPRFQHLWHFSFPVGGGGGGGYICDVETNEIVQMHLKFKILLS